MGTLRLLTKAEAARLVGVDRDTIRKWVRLGYLPQVTVGPHSNPRIREADLLEFVNRNRP